MEIETPTFKFDCSNEKLIFDEGQLDLKKIIGSTNQYIEQLDGQIDGERVDDSSDPESESESEGQDIVINNGGGGSC